MSTTRFSARVRERAIWSGLEVFDLVTHRGTHPAEQCLYALDGPVVCRDVLGRGQQPAGQPTPDRLVTSEGDRLRKAARRVENRVGK